MVCTRTGVDRVERCLVAICIGLVTVGVCWCLRPGFAPTTVERQIQGLMSALQRQDSGIDSRCCPFSTSHETRPLIIALTADITARQFDSYGALELYGRLPRDAGRWERHAELGLARRCELLGRLLAAESHLRRVLALDPSHREALSRLGHLLQLSGRTSEAAPCFLQLVQAGQCRGDELLAVAGSESFFRSDEALERLVREQNPGDPLVELAKARRALLENQHEEALPLLRRVTAQVPDWGEAQGRLGRILLDQGLRDDYRRWQAGLTPAARNHPEVWYVLGLAARARNDWSGAARCAVECLDRFANHLGANQLMTVCLQQLDLRQPAAEFAERSRRLMAVESQLNRIRGDLDLPTLDALCANLAALGRYWEAAGWTAMRMQLIDGSTNGARQSLRHWLNLARHDFCATAANRNPIVGLDRTHWAVPDHQAPASGARTHVDVGDVVWDLREEAAEQGLRFQYFEGSTEATRLQHIFQVVGGGLAATDFDRDGWVDLYLAQGNDWRQPVVADGPRDCLYRNLAGNKFADVTAVSGLGDPDFTHGVAAGDIDQDGFPDLYVGNLGANRLFRNNGDGTFQELTATAGVAGDEWTTSSVLVDFNSDGLPDLYVANYARRVEAASRICFRAPGQMMACTPDQLPAEYHRLYLNQGMGAFRDVTEESGMQVSNGRGLGLLAWDFTGDDRLGLFVANDTTANFLFLPGGAGTAGIPQFREEGVLRGVAFDRDGRAQASMGVAAGDANGDGLIDLYLTNFFGESDTLYCQRADGQFEDQTRAAHLRDAGFFTLGFGTQFADFDCDGWEDLIATNGHVDQQSRRGDSDRTRPQLFHNLRGAGFEEVLPDCAGEFFQRGYLGRGLARLDWNRDGRVDVAISHLHDPLALVTNRTSPVGRPLLIRLVGRVRTREAIGARISLSEPGRTWVRLVTGGDGYLVTNERFAHFAVGRETAAVQVAVTWPGGRKQVWNNIAPGHEIVLVEGRPDPVVLRGLISPP